MVCSGVCRAPFLRRIGKEYILIQMALLKPSTINSNECEM